MIRIIKDLLIIIAIVLVVNIFISPIRVDGNSMVPNLTDGSYVIISKKAYDVGKPKRGNIVVFPVNSNGQEELYIKRVVGLPGDTIEVKDGKLYINGEVMEDTNFNSEEITGSYPLYEVPQGKIFVMGDNVNLSKDSRDSSVGPVSIDEVKGVAFFRVYPFDKFGGL